MKYVRLAIALPPPLRHTMHQFVVDHEGYTASHLLRATEADPAVQTMLFHVDGSPVEPYEAALERTDPVAEYAISTCQDGTFYLYVREHLSGSDQALVAAIAQAGLVVTSPVSFRADGTARLTVVGPGETVQTALGALPHDVSAEVLEVGPYDSQRLDDASALTDRQFEAVAAAVDCGYYGSPRDGSTAAVADALDCTPSTAAEHLRKAEARVMQRLVEAEPPRR